MFDHFFLQPRNSIHVEMEIVKPIGDEILGKFFGIFSFWTTPIGVQGVSTKSVQSKTFRNFHKVGAIVLDCNSHFGQILVVVFDVLQILNKVSLLSFILLIIGTLVAFTKFYLFTRLKCSTQVGYYVLLMLYEPLLRNVLQAYYFFETYESFFSTNVKFSGKKSRHLVAVIFFRPKV